MKTRLFHLLGAGLFLFVFHPVKAQSYNDMPVAVQQKMDDNKANGINIMNGIKVDYEFTISGVTDATSSLVFENLLRSDFGLIAYQFNPSDLHVSFTLPAGFTPEEMKAKFKEKGFSFGLFFKEIYHI